MFSKLLQNKSAKTPTFFMNRKYVSYISENMIDKLEEMCKIEKKVVRICLHFDTKDDLHNMIIAHPKGWNVKPHANKRKSKAYHIIRGEMLIKGLDENRKQLFEIKLSSKYPVFRIEKNIYLELIPLTEIVIFHEIALGPFERELDTVFI